MKDDEHILNWPSVSNIQNNIVNTDIFTLNHWIKWDVHLEYVGQSCDWKPNHQ